MTQPRPDPEHVHLLLGVYTFGIVSSEEAELVERHLAGCAGCRVEYDELAAVLPFLALLAGDEVLSMPGSVGRAGDAVPRNPDAHRRRAPAVPPLPPAGRPRRSPWRPPVW